MTQVLHAAAASRLLPEVSLPSPIAGHGPSSVATIQSDTLEANALLLAAGGRRCLLISYDLLYIGGDLERRVRRELARQYGLADGDVILFASHTHFAPPTDAEIPKFGPCDHAYAAGVFETTMALADAVLAATAEPARLEVRQGPLSHSVNRRRPRRLPTYSREGFNFDRVVLATHATGLRDDNATVVTLVAGGSGRTIGSLFHYACHPVGHVPRAAVSADFPGVARTAIRGVQGAGTPVLFAQGFCGDIRPNFGAAKRGSLIAAAKDFLREAVTGSRLAVTSAPDWREWVTSMGDGVDALARMAPVVAAKELSVASASEHLQLQSIFEGDINKREIRISALTLGRELEIVGLGAEPTIGWQQKLSAGLNGPAKVRLFAGYCGDVFGYLPLAEQIHEGGYEVSGFQPSFGLKGRFRKDVMEKAVTTAVARAHGALRA